MAESERKQASLVGTLDVEGEVPRKIPEGQDLLDEEDLKYEKNNRLLGDWLDKSFRNEGTKKNYGISMYHFVSLIYPDEVGERPDIQWLMMTKNEIMKARKQRKNKIEYYIDKYVANTERVFLEDFKFCLLQLIKKGYAPIYINGHAVRIKKFFDRLDTEKYAISKREMEDIKGTLLPRSIIMTKDEIPTKEELKRILTYFSVKHRALFLFLISTGCRIGAALQLRITDLKLDADPSSAEIRPAYTKGGVGGRTVWFTPETKDALLAWLNVKDTYLKKSGEYFDKKMVFGIAYGAALHAYNAALKKAGLEQRDPNTKMRIRKYHIHTLRKFFRTQMGDAGMPDMYTHAIMGHKAYLSQAYDRPRELAKTYAKYMQAVTIFEKDLETEMRDKLAKGEAEIKGLQTERQETKMILSIIADNLGISNSHELESESLLIQINNAIAKMNKTLAGNAEEIAYLKEITGRPSP